jgi:transposase-like protein
MSDIRSRQWVADRLAAGETVTAIAAAAGVSRQTAHTWIDRHGLHATPKAKPRPPDGELLTLYGQHGSAAAVATVLGVSPDTARRWIIAAGGDLPPAGRRPASIDPAQLRRRRDDGATLAELSTEFGVSTETIRRRLHDQSTPADTNL